MRGMSRVLLLVGLSGVVGWCQPAWATINNLKAYKQAYPDKEPKSISCKTCHEHVIGNKTDLNGYGKALQQLPAPADPKKLTVDDFRAAESADPDHDGATTLQELEAGTNPSDPASVPPAAAGTDAAAPSENGAPASQPVDSSAPSESP